MNNKKHQTRLKIRFYIMSLWLLFLLLFVLTVNVSCICDKNGKFTGIQNVLRCNWLSSINLVLLALGLVFAKRTEYEWAGVKNPPYKVKSVKNENYEYLTFSEEEDVQYDAVLENGQYELAINVSEIEEGATSVGAANVGWEDSFQTE